MVEVIPERIVADRVAEPAAPERDLVTDGGTVRFDERQHQRGLFGAALDVAGEHAGGGGERPVAQALDDLQPGEPEPQVEGAAGKDHGAEMGGGDLGGHGGGGRQGVGNRPLRIAQIGGAGEADAPVIPGLGGEPVERREAIGALVGKGVELAARALGAAAGLDHDVEAALGIGLGDGAEAAPPIGEAHEDGGEGALALGA